ncbi:Translocase inner membrane subunit 8 [Tripterygium wilfordii]|uniref:Mitochondrial import inner membrane translocase subunit n=1 Tax=Tripterygium wilfordii TaxID=458696 RepID=A0A7J7CA38_TRIWF|nr:Translocase inner membrane subunit 8 [Tripterygium wilfordii]
MVAFRLPTTKSDAVEPDTTRRLLAMLIMFSSVDNSSSPLPASITFQIIYKQEKERAMVNEMVAKLTSVCWDKCITSTPGSKFSSSESSCLSHCAQRYMDMSLIIMKRFQSMQ